MTECKISLLKLLSNALFNQPGSIPAQDWQTLLTEAKNQAVVQLADSVLDKTLLSPEEAKAWKQAASQDIANNIQIGHNHSLLHEWMISSNIPYVILKGAASASYYPTPAYRSMGDVDFLVPTNYVERAGKVLEEHGLKPWDEEHISHIVYRGPRMHYELHFNLAGTPHGTAVNGKPPVLAQRKTGSGQLPGGSREIIEGAFGKSPGWHRTREAGHPGRTDPYHPCVWGSQ